MKLISRCPTLMNYASYITELYVNGSAAFQVEPMQYIAQLVWSISSPWVRWDYLSGEQSLKCRMGVVNSGIECELRNPT
ncbi:hypothetical protein T02_14449 [Trichinella nativa]|uniref:Uncharacterized protein n=1 Tax=Trichinella nativa TaxID=6335 RepID=A0A0V1KU73_9BILA|nr:hypothetical protein T02_14449 [Trichinella nativa]